MEVYYNLEKSEAKTAVALGFFDGVHVAHQRIIKKTVEYSKNGIKSCVLTFSQNPRSIVEKANLDLITTTDQKLKIMENMGIQAVYVLDFNSIRHLSSEDFVTKILHGMLQAKAVFCGFNYRFGKSGEGDAAMLKKLCGELNIDVLVEPAVFYGGKPVSSTRIRSAIKNEDFELARSMMAEK